MKLTEQQKEALREEFGNKLFCGTVEFTEHVVDHWLSKIDTILESQQIDFQEKLTLQEERHRKALNNLYNQGKVEGAYEQKENKQKVEVTPLDLFVLGSIPFTFLFFITDIIQHGVFVFNLSMLILLMAVHCFYESYEDKRRNNK